MNNIRIYLSVILLAVWILPSAAQNQSLSLSKAINNALENNYGILISSAEKDISSISNSWGAAGRYPAIGFDISAINNQNLTANQYSGRINAGIGLNWTVFDGFRVNLTKEKLERLEDLSEGRAQLVVENTIEDVILAYHLVLLNKERLSVLEKVMKLSEDRYNYELNKQELGNSVTYNVLQAKNSYLSDKASWLNQETVLRNSIRNLNFLMGEESNVQWTFDTDFSIEPGEFILSDLRDKMLSGNISLANQYINVLLSRNSTAIAKSEYFPSVRLSAGIDNSNVFSPEVQQGSSFSAYGNLTLSYDIYQAGMRKRASEIARIEESISGIEDEELKRSLTNQLLNLYDTYNVRKELLALSDENLDAAALNLEIAGEKFRGGAINSFNYRDIQLIFLNVSYSRLESVYNLISSQTALARITGALLSSEAESSE